MNANKQQISRQDTGRNLTLWHALLHNSSFASIWPDSFDLADFSLAFPEEDLQRFDQYFNLKIIVFLWQNFYWKWLCSHRRESLICCQLARRFYPQTSYVIVW